MKRLILFFYVLVSCTGILAQPFLNAADEKLKAFVTATKVPGLSISISKKGALIYSVGFGFEDVENEIQVDPSQTKFRIGSVSKTYTASGLALLYDQGKIDLDVPIENYLPAWPKKAYLITLRQLGGHLAGIRHYQGREFYSSQNYLTVTDGLAIFMNDSLINIPGTAYAYSIYGWNLIAAAMEKQLENGTTFLGFMEQEVFERLNMKNTIAEHMKSKIPRKTKFYEREGVEVTAASYVDNSYKWAGGGYAGTTEDLCRFGQAHMKAGFLTQSTLDEWMESQKTSNGIATDYGIGWCTFRRENGEIYYGHSGSSVGGTTYFLIHKKSETVLAIAANLSPLNYEELPFELIEMFIDI